MATKKKTATAFAPPSPGVNHPRVMGIINVTPDSFSDGGRFSSEKDLLGQAESMLAAGADLLDIGGESSRPFARPVSLEEEINRVIPAISAIRRELKVPVSIDTTKAEVARQAIEAGADMVNDISALRFDREMAGVVGAGKLPVVLMHMQGTPGNMQNAPHYEDVIAEIREFFLERISWAEQQEISREQIILDPGIGFGKTVKHNLAILSNLGRFKELGCRVLIGHSRKAFIGKLLDLEVADRDLPTAVISAWCALKGVDIIRVHDVAKTVQALKIIRHLA